jgi:oligosaccharide amylase
MRDIPVGNGSLLVTFDDLYRIRDIYFPHVGKENHTDGYPFRFGIWIDGAFSWIDGEGWQRELRYLPETLVSNVRLINESLGVEIVCNDTVVSHRNIFLRRLRVKNLRETKREARIFLHQDFRIYENKVGDTAFYDPESLSLIHYKSNRYFLINTEPHFDQFTTGRKAFKDQDGTWRDAEDGVLSGAAITEGSVDSTIGVKLELDPNGGSEFFYWITAGTSHAEVTELDLHVKNNSPSAVLTQTENYGRAWVNKNDLHFDHLSPEIVDLYKRSLLIVRTQIDNDGAIIAANDSDVTLRATDHYSYLWTRDGAFVAHALDLAGYPSLTRSFFDLCRRIVHRDGYFLQKYAPDGAVASGWHASWDVYAKTPLIPIQEDETALVLWALWKHYAEFRDIEFALRLYQPLITRCADFMMKFRDEKTKLPLPSWNLWEDRKGIHTFTCASVVGGLRAAANFAGLFNETARAEKYEAAADEVVAAMGEHLYSKSARRFLRSLQFHGEGKFEADITVDASLFGTFFFDAFSADDEMVKNTMQAVKEHLEIKTSVGGIARYENDGYMRTESEDKNIPGNPWFICTLWLAEYYIARAKNEEELRDAKKILQWTAESALPSGVLAEQLNPHDGSPVSVSPLTWSHSAFVAVVMSYLRKLAEFSPCELCQRPRFNPDRRAFTI